MQIGFRRDRGYARQGPDEKGGWVCLPDDPAEVQMVLQETPGHVPPGAIGVAEDESPGDVANLAARKDDGFNFEEVRTTPKFVG